MNDYCYDVIEVNEAANTDEVWYAGPTGSGEWLLDVVQFLPYTTTAADGTDYITVAVKNGSTTLGSFNTNSGGTGAALTAGAVTGVTLSGGKSLEFTGGTDVVTVASTNAGCGKAIEGKLQFRFKKLRS